MLGCLFITSTKSSVATEPAMGSFDRITSLSQAAAMLGSAGSEHRAAAASANQGNGVWKTVSCIPLQFVRFGAWTPARTGNAWKGIEKRENALFVALIGRTYLHNQRNAIRVSQQVPFRAVFPAVGRVRPGVDPPKTARTEALSISARDASIWPALPRMQSSLA
jgi:hypothetical protein